MTEQEAQVAEAGGAAAEAKETTTDVKPNAEAGGGEGGEGKEGEPKLTLEQQIEKLTTERDTAVSEKQNVAKKLGEQSGHIKALKDFGNAAKNDPKSLIAKLAKQAGLSVAFADSKPPDLEKPFAEGNAGDQAAAISAAVAHGTSEVMEQLKGPLGAIMESQMVAKYPDWDDHEDGRLAVALGVTSGNLTEQERDHLAVRGLHFEKALEAEGERAVQKYKDDLARKNQEQIDGGKPGKASKPGAKESAQVVENILGDLAGM